jgi:hypothetical protein
MAAADALTPNRVFRDIGFPPFSASSMARLVELKRSEACFDEFTIRLE